MGKIWMMTSACALPVILMLSACSRSENEAENLRHYEVRGIVRGFAPDRSTVEIEHEAIPGFMPAMTMPFTPRDPKEIVNLRRGDAISFRIGLTDKEVWITQIKAIAVGEVHLPTATAPPLIASTSERLREGDAMPAFQLTNEAAERITPQTYRGHPWILTFIFTRCAMPTFCPRMSKNFADLQAATKTGASAEVRLLSITIDPQFDTAEVLKQYAEGERADPKVWQFATGNPSEIDRLTKAFAVYKESESGTINHGLTTALIDREGKIAKIWRGNGWTVKEVIQAIQACP